MTANTKRKREKEKRTEQDTIPRAVTPTPIHNTHHTPHTAQASTHHRTSPLITNTATQREREAGTTRGEQDNVRGPGQLEGEDPIRTRGTPQHTPHPPFNTATTQTGEGANTQTGGSLSHHPPFNAMPPTIRHTAPPSTTAPPTTKNRGEHAEDTPPHEQHRQTHTTHTTHPVQNSSTTRPQYWRVRGGMGGARATPLDSAAGSSTPHRHSTHRTPRRDGHHPLILSHCSHSHTLIDHDQH